MTESRLYAATWECIRVPKDTCRLMILLALSSTSLSDSDGVEVVIRPPFSVRESEKNLEDFVPSHA